jgi:predicted DsbA family dithiol-disulfide isomerase
MTSLKVPVYFDFASTICYVAYKAIDRLNQTLEQLEIELCWTPIDLTKITNVTRNTPTDMTSRENALRVAHELGVPVRMPKRWIDSRLTNCAAILLEGTEKQRSLIDFIFSEQFERGNLIEDGETISRINAKLGIELPPEAFEEALEKLERQTKEAIKELVTGVPTFMLGSWPFPGIQNEHTMRLIFERYASRARRNILN